MLFCIYRALQHSYRLVTTHSIGVESASAQAGMASFYYATDLGKTLSDASSSQLKVLLPCYMCKDITKQVCLSFSPY